MRYAIFTDIHANLEALEAVLAKIDELAQQEAIDQIWFLGDLVGYGPNPNECIEMLRQRTNVIIAGNHDWAAVGKIDIEDFSEAARVSAAWTAEQLTEEHYSFLANLPESLEIDECHLVHGSPYGPLWEYLTSEMLAERSFQHFTNRFCFVGHTHVPTIFQQPDPVANSPTLPLDTQSTSESQSSHPAQKPCDDRDNFDDQETVQIAAIHPTAKLSHQTQSARETLQDLLIDAADVLAEIQQQSADEHHEVASSSSSEDLPEASENCSSVVTLEEQESETAREITPEATILSAEERLNEEIEELLSLLGLSQSMISISNEMITPPEGHWQVPEGYRAIINPGGVGQPRDGDARAAFMIYDTACGFTFYRVPYSIEKTQEKILQANLPPYLATRLAFGR